MMGQVERRLTLALGLPAGASLSRVCAAVEAKVAAVEASHARNLDTIESVGRLERERDEARAELAKVAALLDAEGAGADGEPEPVSTTLQYWLEACTQTEGEIRHSRDEVRIKLGAAEAEIVRLRGQAERAAPDPCRPDLAVVAILLDGLEAEAGKADREGDVAMVRAIRAALGVRT